MFSSLLIGLVATAFAQEEACPGPYANEAFLADLDTIDATLKGLDVDAARDQMSVVHRSLLCLEELVDSDGVARFARQLSLAFFFDQDEDAVRRWALLARTVAPDMAWYADMTDEHPFRELYDRFEDPMMAGPDAVLMPPKKGGIFWNGQLITEAVAPVETPGLVQMADKTGVWLRTWWQDGSAFPDDLLEAPGSPPDPPKWYTPSPPDPRFAAHAAKPLFGEAVVEVPAEPKPELEVDEAVLAAVKEEDAPGTYRNPFEDARRRAIRREFFESSSTNDAGDTITLKTEVVTMARDDRSRGKPVTYEVFHYWLKDVPVWMPDAAASTGKADDTYLSDWIDGKPPPDTSRLPVVYVPYDAAAAYCESFGKALPKAEATFDDPAPWEWRQGAEGPVRRNAKGKIKAEKSGKIARDDTSFRCVDS